MPFFRKNKNRTVSHFGPGIRSQGLKNNFTISKFFYWTAFLSFIGVTTYVLFFSQFLAITKIKVEGTEKIDPASLENEIDSAISGNYLNILPKNSIILLRKDKLSGILSKNFKLIESLVVKKHFPNTLLVSIREKKPRLLLIVDGQEYVVDDKGIAYEKADFESDFLRTNQLPVLEDESGRKISVQEEVLSPDYVNFILDAKEKLEKKLDLGTNQVLKTSNTASGDVELETNEGWKIYFNNDVGLEKELKMLKVVLDNKIEKGERGELEYVDLRTDNKVYYKFKQPVNEESVKIEDKLK